MENELAVGTGGNRETSLLAITSTAKDGDGLKSGGECGDPVTDGSTRGMLGVRERERLHLC